MPKTPKPIVDPDRAHLAALVRALTRRRAAPALADTELEFLLRLLAKRDRDLAELIEREAMATIEGEKR